MRNKTQVRENTGGYAEGMEEISYGTGERDRLKNAKLSTRDEMNVQPCGTCSEKRCIVERETPFLCFSRRVRARILPPSNTCLHTSPKYNSIS